MPPESRNNLTFEGLKRFLFSIGFNQHARTDQALAFHHGESGTLFMLSIPSDGRTVRPADLLSLSIRLERQGIVSDSVLNEIKSGKLPLAS
jgi:hypothetical protein